MPDNFEAVLDKNAIARELAQFRRGEGLNVEYVLTKLEQLEAYIGTSNQPAVRNIFEHNSNPNRTFTI